MAEDKRLERFFGTTCLPKFVRIETDPEKDELDRPTISEQRRSRDPEDESNA